MKKLLMLLSVTFAFTFVNAQCSHSAKTKSEATKTETKKVEQKKSCSGSKGKSCAKTCGSSQAAYNKLVSPQDFVEYMNRFPAEQVVDIRTKAEIQANGMIDGAKNIDFKASYFKEEMLKLDKNIAIMIYCRAGNKSAKAVEMLKSWGFKKIYDMEGGYNAYLKAFPVSK